MIVEKLLENFHTIRNVKIHRHALWILGEHCTEANEILTVMKEIQSGLGEVPIVDDELRRASKDQEDDDESEKKETSGKCNKYAMKSSRCSVGSLIVRRYHRIRLPAILFLYSNISIKLIVCKQTSHVVFILILCSMHERWGL